MIILSFTLFFFDFNTIYPKYYVSSTTVSAKFISLYIVLFKSFKTRNLLSIVTTPFLGENFFYSEFFDYIVHDVTDIYSKAPLLIY